MPATGLDHFNIRAPLSLLEQVRDFYCELLDLRAGARPNFAFAGYWLYAGEHAILHLSASDAESTGVPVRERETGWFDHIAIRCTALEQIRARLRDMGVEHVVRAIAEPKQVQIFLHDPAGVRVELNFAGCDPA